GRLGVGHYHDLRRSGAAFHGHLEVPDESAVRVIGVRSGPGFADGLPQFGGDFVDQRVMNEAAGDVDDPVRAGLEDPDLGRSRPTAHRETGPVTERGLGATNDRQGNPSGASELLERRARAGRDLRLTEARAAGTGRPMWARKHAPLVPRAAENAKLLA